MTNQGHANKAMLDTTSHMSNQKILSLTIITSERIWRKMLKLAFICTHQYNNFEE